MGRLNEQFQWYVQVRRTDGDRPIIGHADDAYLEPAPFTSGCVIRADFESLPMPPCCCAVNDGLITEPEPSWRPAGNLEISIFANRLADDREAQIMSFVIDFDLLVEGSGDHAVLRDWNEEVRATACWGSTSEVPHWPGPTNHPLSATVNSGVLGIDGESPLESPWSWRLRSLILTFFVQPAGEHETSWGDTSITARDWWNVLHSIDVDWV